MTETITAQRMALLQWVAKNPDAHKDRMLALKGITAADIAYLEQHDLIRESREVGCYRVSHLGQLALKRGI